MAAPWTLSPALASIACDEQLGSPRESLGPRGPIARVDLKVPWPYRLQVLNDIVTNNIRYPYQGAPFNATAALRALSGSVTPFPAKQLAGSHFPFIGTTSLYEFALVSIEYGYLNAFPVNSQLTHFYTEDFDVNVTAFRLDPLAFEWSSRARVGLSNSEAPQQYVMGGEWRITWYGVSQQKIGASSIWDSVGHVNASSITSPTYGRTFDPGTLLYMAPSIKASSGITHATGHVFEVLLRIQWREIPWNKFYDVRGGTNFEGLWDDIKLDGASEVYKVFPSASFAGALPFVV